MESLQDTTSTPPYILGNFRRVEIVFDCIEHSPPSSFSAEGGDPKYTRLVNLKKLLDAGVITQTEFDQEKAKTLSQP